VQHKGRNAKNTLRVLRWFHALIWAYQPRLVSTHATHPVKGRDKWRTYEETIMVKLRYKLSISSWAGLGLPLFSLMILFPSF